MTQSQESTDLTFSFRCERLDWHLLFAIGFSGGRLLVFISKHELFYCFRLAGLEDVEYVANGILDIYKIEGASIETLDDDERQQIVVGVEAKSIIIAVSEAGRVQHS